MVYSGAISWQVRKQQTVALSSCEAENQGLAAAAQEVLFLRQLIANIHYPQNQPTDLGEDYQSTVKLSTNPVSHKKSTHIDVKQHFLLDAVQKNRINIRYVPTQKLAADFSPK